MKKLAMLLSVAILLCACGKKEEKPAGGLLDTVKKSAEEVKQSADKASKDAQKEADKAAEEAKKKAEEAKKALGGK